MRNSIIISITSDIGYEISKHLLEKNTEQNKNENLYGTYLRENEEKIKFLNDNNVKLYKCDLSLKKSINTLIYKLKNIHWDNLIMCPGTLLPIGNFENIDFFDWEESFKINAINQLRIINKLLPYRNKDAHILLFAGGGTNNATMNFSAYTLSKICLIKACELLDFEINDAIFSIVGPGYVNTKIHQEMINNKEKAPENYLKTLEVIKNNSFTPMEKVIECCEWILNSPKEIVGGRNFSVAHDKWGTDGLENLLKNDENLYKLRRYGNNITN